VKAILQSFEPLQAGAEPPTHAPTLSPLAEDARATYTSEEFGFSVQYPAELSLAEAPSH
jgi:hypothetical protein